MEQTPPAAKKAKNSGDAATDEDRLSALGDDTLREILARLRLRDAAATTALSGRWPRVFATLPRLRLDSTTFNRRASLDDGVDYCEDNNRWVDALDRVLDGRESPVAAFEVDADIDLLEGYSEWFYDFFCTLCRSGGLRELRVRTLHVHECYLVPSPVYACETLTSLELDSCRLRVPARLTGLRAVRSLVLREVVVTDVDLRRMVSRCRAVERLVLDSCRRVRNVVIRGPSLKELEIYSYRPLCVALKTAPFLHSVKMGLSYGCPDGSWSIYDNSDGEIASKSSDRDAVEELFDFEAQEKREHRKANEAANIVTFVSGLRCARELFLYLPNKYAKVLRKSSNSVPIKLPKKCYLLGLQKLTLYHDHNHEALAKLVACLLNSSPNLKDLEIIVPSATGYAEPLAAEFWEKQIDADSVRNHLSNVTFYMWDSPFKGPARIGLSQFLVMNATVLKRISFKYHRSQDKPENAARLEAVRSELSLWPRASPNVLLELSPADRFPYI